MKYVAHFYYYIHVHVWAI